MISKRLATAMHGSIGVESRVGAGSTFWVTMRFQRQGSPPPEPAFEQRYLGTRVLVVDDNETRRHVLHEQLSAWGLDKGRAGTCSDAVEVMRQAAAARTPYQVAIVDLHRTDAAGLTLVRAIIAEPLFNATRIVLLLPFGDFIAAAELEALRVAGWCSKPVRPSALFDCLVQAFFRAGHPVVSSPDPILRSRLAPPLRAERVLVAEDNVVNQQVALGNLRKLGYQADVASNGIEALRALERTRYDIILMDCQMPELDGYESTRAIRANQRAGHRPYIIAMTANVMAGDREKCLAAGMDDYLGKPLDRGALVAALERGTARRQPEGAVERPWAPLAVDD